MSRWLEFGQGLTGATFESATTQRRRFYLLSLLLVVATFVVYIRVLDHDFVSIDDPTHVTENPHLLPVSMDGVLYFWRWPYASMYMPLSYSFFAAETWLAERYDAGGQLVLDPRVFHVVSVSLHVVNVLLVFAVLRLLACEPAACLLGALLFACHPLQVQSVAWVSATPGMLAAFFSLIAIYHYLRFRGASWHPPTETAAYSDEESRRSRACSRWHFVLAFVAYGLALLCKPSAAALPLMLMVFDVAWFRCRLLGTLALFAPWLAPALFLASLTHDLQARHIEEFVNVPAWYLRPFLAGDAVAFYLGKLIWPVGLAIDAGRTPEFVFAQPWVYVAWIAPAALLVLCCWSPERRAWLTACGLFVAGVAPVLGFVPFVFQDISTVANHYVYLAMLGPAWAVAWFLSRPYGRAWRTEFAVGLLLLAAFTVRETGFWRDSRTLAERGLTVNPRSVVAMSALAQVALDEHRTTEAESLLRRATEVDPHGARVWTTLGLFYVQVGRDRDAEIAFTRAADECSFDPLPHLQMAKLRLRQGKYELVVAEMQNLLQAMPDQLEGWTSMLTALFELGRQEEVVAQGNMLLDANPALFEVHVLVGKSLARLGRTAEAKQHFKAAQALRPNDAEVYPLLKQLDELPTGR